MFESNGDGDVSDDPEDDDAAAVAAPRAQIVTIGCWQTVREVGLLLAAIANGIPSDGVLRVCGLTDPGLRKLACRVSTGPGSAGISPKHSLCSARPNKHLTVPSCPSGSDPKIRQCVGLYLMRSCENMCCTGCNLSTACLVSAGDLLTSRHIRTLGDAALRLMMEMKHNGAIETVQVGLTAVAARYATFTSISLRVRGHICMRTSSQAAAAHSAQGLAAG